MSSWRLSGTRAAPPRRGAVPRSLGAFDRFPPDTRLNNEYIRPKVPLDRSLESEAILDDERFVLFLANKGGVVVSERQHQNSAQIGSSGAGSVGINLGPADSSTSAKPPKTP